MRCTLILALCFLAVVVPAAAADVPYGDFVFNGIVSKIAPSPD
jgi:hypothetical protein